VMVYSEELDDEGRPKRALVTPETAQLLDEVGEGSLGKIGSICRSFTVDLSSFHKHYLGFI
jgi:hypothetical protein